MEQNLDKTISDMLAAFRGVVADRWESLNDTAGEFLESRKERLELLTQSRLTGEIDDAFFQARLADERSILESELNALNVISKALAQQAANAAFDVLGKAVKTAIGTIM
ncbi:MAG: hypothetical protein JSS82_14220 [Bacteroidetes bacterium]|nr:hypothetical protein [Bacteroidota bacterium]